MASTFYMKLYYEILDDPKMGLLPDHIWRRCIELFLTAGEFDRNGYLPPIKDIAWRMRTDQKDIEEVFQYLMSEEIQIVIKDDVGYKIKNLVKRQGRISDAERMEAYRDRLHSGYEPVTTRNTDIDIDINKDNTHLSENSPQTNQQISDKEFVGKFLSVSGIEFLENNQQGVRLVDFRHHYGDEKVLSFAEWANDKQFASMEKALKSMQTALPDWNDPPPKKEKSFGRHPKKKVRTVADVVPEQTEEQTRSIAQQLFEFNKAREAEEARKAWVRADQSVEV